MWRSKEDKFTRRKRRTRTRDRRQEKQKKNARTRDRRQEKQKRMLERGREGKRNKKNECEKKIRVEI